MPTAGIDPVRLVEAGWGCRTGVDPVRGEPCTPGAPTLAVEWAVGTSSLGRFGDGVEVPKEPAAAPAVSAVSSGRPEVSLLESRRLVVDRDGGVRPIAAANVASSLVETPSVFSVDSDTPRSVRDQYRAVGGRAPRTQQPT